MFENINFTKFLNEQIGANSVKNYLVSFCLFLLIIILLYLFKSIVVGKFENKMKIVTVEIGEAFMYMVNTFNWFFFSVVALFVATRFISIPQLLDRIISIIFLISIVLFLTTFLQRLIDFLFKIFIDRMTKKDPAYNIAIINFIKGILKISLWIAMVLLVVDNLGLNISALVAGFGVSSIVLAFALQRILEDIFASLSIHFDKPFVVGDFITVSSDSGVVQKIGLKSTRIKTLQGEELVISNKELATARIKNSKQLTKRRVSFTFKVANDTSLDKLKKIQELVKKIIVNIDGIEFVRVSFIEFGSGGLNFEVVYKILSRDYEKYINTQQEINYKLIEIFEKEKIEVK